MPKSLAALQAVVVVLAVLFGLRALPDRAAGSPGGANAGLEGALASLLRDKPQIVFDALRAAEMRERTEVEQRARAAIAANLEAIGSADSPVLGNPNGNVMIVEFFDYQCPYCRRATPGLLDTVAADGQVRLIMKEWPILGPDSVYAARAALAAHKQGKYAEIHHAMMSAQGRLNEQAILSIAAKLGINIAQLMRDMASPGIDRELQNNHETARTLGLEGTPAFIVGKELVPGAANSETLRALIARARKG